MIIAELIFNEICDVYSFCLFYGHVGMPGLVRDCPFKTESQCITFILHRTIDAIAFQDFAILRDKTHLEKIDLLFFFYRMVSSRVSTWKNKSSLLVELAIRILSDPYDSNSSKGIIDLSVSQHQLLIPIVARKMNELSSVEFLPFDCCYGDMQGFLGLRKSFSLLLGACDADDICVVNGLGSALEAVSFILADHGDSIVTPSPFYGGLVNDCAQRPGLDLVGSVMPNFAFSLEALEETCLSLGNRVAFVLLVNPWNPLGTVLTLDQVKSVADYCLSQNLHLVVDEAFRFSVYEGGFQSALELYALKKYDEMLHVIYGVSKDFGLGGERCGVIITKNLAAKQAFKDLGYYYALSHYVQRRMEKFLRDTQFIDSLLLSSRQMLKQNAIIVKSWTKDMEKKFHRPLFLLPARAGFFLWIGFQHFLVTQSTDEELKLTEQFLNHGVGIAPGIASHCTKPGYFRLMMASPHLVEGLSRVARALEDYAASHY